MQASTAQPGNSTGSTLDALIDEALPNAMYRVISDDGQVLHTTVSTELRRYSVKVLPGDRVTVEVSAYDPSRGRIIRRHP